MKAASCLSAFAFWAPRVKAEERGRGGVDQVVSRIVDWELLGSFDEDGVEPFAILASCCLALDANGAAHELLGFSLGAGRDDQAGPGGPAGVIVLMGDPTFHGAIA